MRDDRADRDSQAKLQIVGDETLAGAKIAGYDAGPVRTPLTDLTGEEYEMLAALMDKMGPQ